VTERRWTPRAVQIAWSASVRGRRGRWGRAAVSQVRPASAGCTARPRSAPSRRSRSGVGKVLVDAAIKAIKGEQLPEVIDPGLDWYGRSNIDDPTNKAVLWE